MRCFRKSVVSCCTRTVSSCRRDGFAASINLAQPGKTLVQDAGAEIKLFERVLQLVPKRSHHHSSQSRYCKHTGYSCHRIVNA